MLQFIAKPASGDHKGILDLSSFVGLTSLGDDLEPEKRQKELTDVSWQEKTSEPLWVTGATCFPSK